MTDGSSSWRRLLPPAAVTIGMALALALVYGPWYLNYDARYALLWARDLLDGFTPEYEADFAPTPHPLQMAFGLLAVPLGEGADDLMLGAVLLCFGLLVWLVYRLGTELFSPWVGVVTAVVVATRPALQRDAVLAYQDVPFAALIVGAVLMEARRPRRGLPVLGLLVVAGLLRPEAWVLAGLYALWLWPVRDVRGRVIALALAGVAPVVWALSDFLVTGDPLHSLHGTADLAAAVDRRRSPSQVPFWTAQYFGYVLREPVVAALPLGLAFAYVYRRQRALLPLAVAAAMVAVFAIGPFFGLPLIGRYIRTPAILVALFYGLAVCGWLALPRGRARTRWMIVGVLAAALSVAFLPRHVAMLQGLERRLDADGAFYGDLRAAGEAPAVRAALEKCGRLTTADHRPIPFIRWWMDGDPGSVGTVAGDASPVSRVFLSPRDTRATRRKFRENFPRAKPPPEYRVIYRNATWQVHAAPGC